MAFPAAHASDLQLTRTEFTMPGDGAPNNNSSIGPFCCTGSTATIEAADGSAAGYIYYADFTYGTMMRTMSEINRSRGS